MTAKARLQERRRGVSLSPWRNKIGQRPMVLVARFTARLGGEVCGFLVNRAVSSPFTAEYECAFRDLFPLDQSHIWSVHHDGAPYSPNKAKSQIFGSPNIAT